MDDKKLNTVTAKYNRTGYVVMVNGIEVYRAGNKPWESRLSLDTISGYCRQTALDIARYCNGRVDEIKHCLGDCEV